MLRKLACDILTGWEMVGFGVQAFSLLLCIAKGLLSFALSLSSSFLFFAELGNKLLSIVPQQLSFFEREPASINRAVDWFQSPTRRSHPKFPPVTVLTPTLDTTIRPHNDVHTFVDNVSTGLALALYAVFEGNFDYCSQVPQGRLRRWHKHSSYRS